jgi:perosamine synthetase
MEQLAIFGGRKIRKKEFVNKPHIDNNEIKLVIQLMKQGNFSKFVGSPIDGTREILGLPSKDLNFKTKSSSFLGGNYVRKFEYLWASKINSKYCISVNSATSGLITAILALNLPKNSEILTTPFSFTATGAAIPLANCIPKFVDIDKDTFCIDPKKISARITKNTKAVIYVHWCGNPGHFKEILKICRINKIPLIEDAAQVPGTKYKGKYLGTFGDLGVFSFNEPKNIMTGEGGMIVTNNKQYAIKSRLIRNHGESLLNKDDKDSLVQNSIGYNFRLTELQAAIGCAQVKKLNYLNKIRNKNYTYLINGLKEINIQYLKPQKILGTNNYSAYTAAFQWDSDKSGVHRNFISDILTAEGIPNFKGYPVLMSEQEHIRRGVSSSKKIVVKPKYNMDLKHTEIAKNLITNKFIGFLNMGWPNTQKDMEDLIKVWYKIKYHLKDLKGKEYKIYNSFKLGR